MGRLKNGKWIVDGIIPQSSNGEFNRTDSTFRDTITEDGKYKPETGRYHLYISLACPWASRAYIFLKLKKLEKIVTVSIVSPKMLDQGWSFEEDFPGVISDTVLNKKYLYEIYQEADPNFTGKVTVPVLFDKKTNTIVNNESSEIIRIFNSAFNQITGDKNDFYPETLRSEIDQINAHIYDDINNGVYKAGFAKNQAAYNENVKTLFAALDKIEQHLEERETLVGSIVTEADVRLYTTLVRFDPVYHGHFKCNLKMLREYKNLSRYLLDLYSLKAFKETTDFDHIKEHYYFSQIEINPNQIVPLGPSNNLPTQVKTKEAAVDNHLLADEELNIEAHEEAPVT
jgi:putative glutathione S-transferase